MEYADALERLQAMPAFVEAALREAGPGEIEVRPSPDEFSLSEHACHLRDLDREGYLVRVRRMLGERAPELAGFDGAAVARERDYASQDGPKAAQDFAAARRELVDVLSALTPADLGRQALIGGRSITLTDLVAMIVEHDREHREEIERLLDDIED